MNSRTNTLTMAPQPVCPGWCATHADELHYGLPHIYSDEHQGMTQELLVQLVGFEDETSVTIGARWPGAEAWAQLHPDFPLSVAGAAWLAQTLANVATVAGGRTERPELAVATFRRTVFGIPTLVCVDCGAEVSVDSTPSLDRCWQCAEQHEAENGLVAI